MSLKKLQLPNILFLDIETVPEEQNFDALSADKKILWADKTKYKRGDEFTPEDFYERAGIWAEFGKIVCISVGYFKLFGNARSFRLKTFSGAEQQLLKEFKALLKNYFNKPRHLLC